MDALEIDEVDVDREIKKACTAFPSWPSEGNSAGNVRDLRERLDGIPQTAGRLETMRRLLDG